MRKVTITDVRNRARNLSETTKPIDQSVCKSFSELAVNGRIKDIENAIKNISEYNMNVPFYNIMEMYDAVVSRGSNNDIERIGNIIIESSLPKVRDAKQTQTLLRRRLGRTKTKLNAGSYITKSIGEIINAQQSASPAPVSSSNSYSSDAADNVVAEMYCKMYEAATVYENIDRVLENYDRISKRFNLEILFNENSRINGINDTIVELCNRIDTYTMPTDVKFNIAIETAWYGFESNNIDYEKSQILETAIDYFLFKENGLNNCKNVLDTTIFFDKDKDMGDIDILMEDEPNDADSIYTPNSIDESIISHCCADFVLNEEMFTKNDGTADFEKIFDNFKKTELSENPESKLKSLVNKLYSRSVSGVVEETPKFLAWIRSFFILGSGAIPVIGPVLAVIGYIADRCIQLHMEKDQIAKMVICFNKEIESANKKLNSTKDRQTKEKLKKYIDSLEKGTSKIRSYYEDLFDADEEHPDSYSMGTDNDFDFDDMFDFDEAFTGLSNSVENFKNNTSIITEEMMYSLIRYGNLDVDDMINIATAAAKFPNVFYKDTVESAIKDSINEIRNNNSNFDTLLGKYMKSTALNTAYSTLMTTEKELPSEDICIAKEQFDAIAESYSAINIFINSISENNDICNIMEASFTNGLKMASMKLKNAMKKLSDKGRKTSKNIDISLNNLTKGIERSLTNDNREAIIKGSILPSASKVIKAGMLAAGVGYLVSPVVSVIGALGYLACSGKYKAKERQMIIDELEIELKMCKKYIDIAESKNDMKALKDLLTTQRNLERQLQRIKYKMKVQYGQKYYDNKDIE